LHVLILEWFIRRLRVYFTPPLETKMRTFSPDTAIHMVLRENKPNQNKTKQMCLPVLYWFVITFPCNARSDWLKQRILSETRAQVDDGKLAFQFFLRNFDNLNLTQISIPCDSEKRNGNELFVWSRYGSQRPLLPTVVLKLNQNNKQNTQRNKQILNLTALRWETLCLLRRQKLYLRIKKKRHKTAMELSVFMFL